MNQNTNTRKLSQTTSMHGLARGTAVHGRQHKLVGPVKRPLVSSELSKNKDENGKIKVKELYKQTNKVNITIK